MVKIGRYTTAAASPPAAPSWRWCTDFIQRRNMTITDLRNAATFLRRLVVGRTEEDRLFRTIAAIEREIARREKRDG